MNAKGIVKFSDMEYKLVFDIQSHVTQKFIKNLPIVSIANNIGGEIYFRVPGVDLQYDGTECEEFEIGDIVYWRSPIGEKKFSIVILYGNTQFSNWKSPRTSDPCVKIGRIIDDICAMESIKTGKIVNISIL